MRRALIPALCTLLTAGCSTPQGTPAETSPPSDSPVSSTTLPPPVQVVGRVIAVDMRELAVVVEVPPYETLPLDYSGRILISRSDDLRPTARLQASPYLRGRTLGARLLAGRAQIGEEVVFAPAAP